MGKPTSYLLITIVSLTSLKTVIWLLSFVCFFSKVEQRRNTVETSSGRNLQQTEATAAKKKLQLLPCTSTACMKFGTPGQNGLCDDCYRKKGIRQQGASSTAEANEQQGSSISGNLHSAQTTVQNHPIGNSSAQPAYYGLPGPVQVSQTQSPSYESGMANSGNDAFHGQKCRGTNCTLFGTPETNGYCSRCFLESTIPLSYPHSIPGNVSWVSMIIITVFSISFPWVGKVFTDIECSHSGEMQDAGGGGVGWSNARSSVSCVAS